MTPNLLQTRTKKADLYRLVFHTNFVKYVVAAMMVFFLLHPVMPAFASEMAAEESAPEAAVEAQPDEVVTEAAPEVPEETIVEPEVTIEEVVTEDTTAEVTPLDTPLPTEVTSEVSPLEPVITDTPVPENTDESVGESAPEDTETPEVLPEQTNDGEVDDTSSGFDSDTPNDDTTDETEIGTTTVPEPEFYEVANTIAHSDTHYQFNKAQCVSMGGGAFHCFEEGTTAEAVTKDALYVDRDSDGDKEVYLRTGGEVTQITNNKVDDDAPYFDAVSNTIVWHRLEGGQYAIYSYQDARETLVSEGFPSSMEPHRAGQYTVWQSWIDNHWQVVLHDGATARVISTGGAQSIAPQVEGAYVIWNVTTGTTHTVAVYEIATGLTSVIDDGEGARVMNPRFVLVYDTKFENGDVITKGYDAETGDLIPLAAAAPVVPTELPSSDQTGETRALLQNKSSSREEFKDELEPTEDTAVASSSPQGGATSSSVDTIVITSPGAVSDVLPLTDFDIIVEPFTASPSATSTQ